MILSGNTQPTPSLDRDKINHNSDNVATHEEVSREALFLSRFVLFHRLLRTDRGGSNAERSLYRKSRGCTRLQSKRWVHDLRRTNTRNTARRSRGGPIDSRAGRSTAGSGTDPSVTDARNPNGSGDSSASANSTTDPTSDSISDPTSGDSAADV